MGKESEIEWIYTYVLRKKKKRERERCLIIVGGLLSDVSLSGVSSGQLEPWARTSILTLFDRVGAVGFRRS